MDTHVRFEALYLTHRRAVWAFIRRRTSADVAEDLVADVFVLAWRRLDQAPASDELPWLLGIARGVLANVRRGDARRLALGERLRVNQEPLEVQSPVFEGVEQRVATALRTLSSSDRELLLLVAWDGLERDGAAQVLGVSRSTLAVRLHRARRRFARALAVEDARREPAARRTAITEVRCDDR